VALGNKLPSLTPVRSRAATAVVAATCCVLAAVPAAQARASPAGSRSPATITHVTIDGRRRGPVFDGVGAISSAGTSRLLIDYPRRERTQILNYLFGPGGADLQILKLEIGGDGGSSDGAEPSVEHSQGQIDCQPGYEWWLAEQAVARNPGIRLAALQWSAPGWIGPSVWTRSDIDYLVNWLNCARSHRLTISYLGGWDEHGYKVGWYEDLRKALDAHGYRSVGLMAADTFPGRNYDWSRAWRVAKAAAADPAFKATLSVIGAHDTCGGPTRGFVCQSTPAARRLGLPLWESELGTLHGAQSAASMARTINNGFIQADISGFLEWPLISSMPPGLVYGGRGMVTAAEPQAGHYSVNPITWAIAQTTQFVKPGWRHVTGTSGDIGQTGTYDAYVAPRGHDWSLVAENAGNRPDQAARAQTIVVRLTGGLKSARIGVWTTNLSSGKPSTWFVRQRDVAVTDGTFTYTIKPDFAVSFTSTTGQSHRRYQVPRMAPSRLPYTATPDGSDEAWGLATQEGAFVYQHCLGGEAGRCIEQLSGQTPVWWRPPRFGVPFPYAVTGSTTWANYTVSASVLIPAPTDWAGVVGRFSAQSRYDPSLFNGYELQLRGNGKWHLLVNSTNPRPFVLASGTARGVQPGGWASISLSLRGDEITAEINGKLVATKTNSAYRSGLAGIESDWISAQFTGLKVVTAPPGSQA
jgi:Glycosyl hydrolase family 59/Concanavalin A-like lectin/glucanases superfamily